MNTPEAKNIEIYSRGLVFSSVCTNMSKKELIEYLGEHEPTGIDSPWTVANEDFKDGTPNGCPCPDTKGNKHWLVSC